MGSTLVVSDTVGLIQGWGQRIWISTKLQSDADPDCALSTTGLEFGQQCLSVIKGNVRAWNKMHQGNEKTQSDRGGQIYR